MPNFYYTDATGQKRGLINHEQLKVLAIRGIITPDTLLETDTGKKGKAGQIKGLFPAVPSPIIQTAPLKVSVPVAAKIKRSHLIIGIVVALGTQWTELSVPLHQLPNSTLRRGIEPIRNYVSQCPRRTL